MGAGLKILSGKKVIAIFTSFGFVVRSQKGSHIKLQRKGASGTETLVIPERAQVPKGTLRAILKQASAYISQDKLRPHFYNE